MATTRLRKTFHYPADSDTDEPPEGIDEEEQEQLISTLATQDAEKTALYTKAFLTLPLLAALVFLPSLLHPTSFSAFLTALLNLTSLGCTAYVLYYLPLPPSSEAQGEGRAVRGSSGLGSAMDDKGPVERHLVYLNGGLCGILALGEWMGREKVGGWGWLPAVTFVLVLIARVLLRPVDVGGLEGLKYRYKGA
ncbi:hypothetical protein H2199_004946 [Coniosporium tulheliwenetii]|uniref:Uncharacterized protein n=1 Tax=Coniosporium tulheliwenetii TaxID=3383036 RepID=A0ACC2Z4S5_9PEZI|nr:hypothetical protein H2199_004946 [Cladosporium sp. JES 115]